MGGKEGEDEKLVAGILTACSFTVLPYCFCFGVGFLVLRFLSVNLRLLILITPLFVAAPFTGILAIMVALLFAIVSALVFFLMLVAYDAYRCFLEWVS